MSVPFYRDSPAERPIRPQRSQAAPDPSSGLSDQRPRLCSFVCCSFAFNGHSPDSWRMDLILRQPIHSYRRRNPSCTFCTPWVLFQVNIVNQEVRHGWLHWQVSKARVGREHKPPRKPGQKVQPNRSMRISPGRFSAFCSSILSERLRVSRHLALTGSQFCGIHNRLGSPTRRTLGKLNRLP